MYQTLFINAIKEKRKIRVTFFSKEDRTNITRICAPMDYGPSTRAKEKNDRYHMWDYDSDTAKHTLSLPPEQIVKIELLQDVFNPSEFITWNTNWFISRDWGVFS